MTEDEPGGDDSSIPATELDQILALLAAQRLDLRDYKRATLARRVATRMALARCQDAAAYRSRLERDPEELDQLAGALLIHVTAFFRDPLVFAALEQTVVPALLAEKLPGEPFRALVIGTATGEEAYSLAIVLRAVLDDRPTRWEILATDRDEPSLDFARRGLYARSAVTGSMPAPVASRFFHGEEGLLRVSDELTERVRFVEHDFMGARLAPREAIVAEFDLVLCRNVLLYLDGRFQDAAFQRLATVLRERGVLVLGPAETVPGTSRDRFQEHPGLDPGLRIFERVRTAT